MANPPNGASDAARLQHLESRFAALCAAELQLDLTRGKPCTAQLDLSDGLLAMLSKPLRSQDGIDVRNYGHLDGLPEAKRLGATLLGVEPTDVLVGGNSSLSLMYCCILFAHAFGLRPGAAPWSHEGKVRFLCPVPGYDRHFAICDTFGIEMIPVPLTGAGPDMDEVEALVRRDPTIKGIWCVPKYSNPTGETYSDETVARIAALPRAAGSGFVVMWDNAYAVHDLGPERIQLADLMGLARKAGTADAVLLTASTSKVTYAGAGISFLASAPETLARFAKHLGVHTIGANKVNQLAHARFLPDTATLETHMRRHAAILAPKFRCVLETLEQRLQALNIAEWSQPKGGYFVSLDTQPGLARQVVELCTQAGVKLTPAGATFPLGQDPENRNIRIAPTFPSLDELQQSMEVLVTAIELATLRARSTGA